MSGVTRSRPLVCGSTAEPSNGRVDSICPVGLRGDRELEHDEELRSPLLPGFALPVDAPFPHE